jgi:hypothetical protein
MENNCINPITHGFNEYGQYSQNGRVIFDYEGRCQRTEEEDMIIDFLLESHSNSQEEQEKPENPMDLDDQEEPENLMGLDDSLYTGDIGIDFLFMVFLERLKSDEIEEQKRKRECNEDIGIFSRTRSRK